MFEITDEELIALLKRGAFDDAIYKLTSNIRNLQEMHAKRAKKGFNSELYLLYYNLGYTYCKKNQASPHLRLSSLALECYLKAFELIEQSSLVDDDSIYYFQERMKIVGLIQWLAQEVIKEVHSQMEVVEQAWQQLGKDAYDFDLEKNLSHIIGKIGYLREQVLFTTEIRTLRRYLADSLYYVGVLLFNNKVIEDARVNLLDAHKIYVEYPLFKKVSEVNKYLSRCEFLITTSPRHPGVSTGQMLQRLSGVAAAADEVFNQSEVFDDCNFVAGPAESMSLVVLEASSSAGGSKSTSIGTKRLYSCC